MEKETIAVASDHAGYEMKEFAKNLLSGLGFDVLDLGAHSADSVDYPDFGKAMGSVIATGEVKRGILVCGSGIGISIAANRNPAVRAALVHDGLSARLSRQHNDANVLVLGGRLIGEERARDCITSFLNTEFEGGRHGRRVDMLGQN